MFLLVTFQKIFQSVELIFPEMVVETHPFGRISQGLGLQAATAHAAFFVETAQPGIFEHSHVLQDSHQGHCMGSGQFTDGSFAFGQPRQDGSARRVGQRAKGGVEGRTLILNHMVKYRWAIPLVKSYLQFN